MFSWKENYRWSFSDLGSADSVGINEAGIGIFRRQPYISLTKEILQNVTDVRNYELPEDVPVKARFELIYVDLEDIPGYERLHEVIHKCAEYYSEGEDGKKLQILQDAADKYLTDTTRKVPVLKISDYNTRGASGVREKKGSDWTGLVRERSATNKSHGSSGSFGVGKFAPYNFTSVRTVLYSTKAVKDGNYEYAFQGKAIFTTFEEDGVAKQNIGLFADANSDNYDAVFDVNDVAPVFRRTEVGTDIFVVGFESDNDWVEQSAISVIEYFFYAIYQGKLEVEIIDGDKQVVIKKDNLGEMITSYKDLCDIYMAEDTSFAFTAPQYWKMLNDKRHKVIVKPFEYRGKNMGNYELYLLVDEDMPDKRVLEMRQAGMKIREDISFRIPINFAAIFIATGEGAVSKEPEDNISSFLRKCENQAHNDWAADEYKEEKDKARSIINKVHQIILEAVKEELPDFGEESVDAFGLSEFLPSEETDENNEQEETAFLDFNPLTFETQSVQTGKRRRKADISMKKNGGSKHNDDDSKKKKKKHDPKNPDNHRGTGKENVSEIPLLSVKTPYDKSAQAYQISFATKEDAKDVMLGIRIGSDDDNFSKAEIVFASIKGKNLEIKDGMIEVGTVTKGDKNILSVRLNDAIRKSLEVRAYAKH